MSLCQGLHGHGIYASEDPVVFSANRAFNLPRQNQSRTSRLPPSPRKCSNTKIFGSSATMVHTLILSASILCRLKSTYGHKLSECFASLYSKQSHRVVETSDTAFPNKTDSAFFGQFRDLTRRQTLLVTV